MQRYNESRSCSSVAPLAIGWRSNFPTLFQRLADLELGELLLLRKIFTRVAWLTVFRDKFRRLNVLRFPIEIENLIIRPQIILRVAMAIQAPRHAVGLGDVNHRHVINRAVATETANAPVHVRRVVVINVIDGAIQPHPLDRLTAFPALLHRLQLGIVFRHLRMAVHARCGVGHVRLRGHFHETVTIPAIHSQLVHVDIMRERHRLDRLVSDFCVLRRGVIPRRPCQGTSDHNHANDQLERYPIRPAWKEIGHGARQTSHRHSATAELPMNENCDQDTLRSDATKWLRLIVPGEQLGFYKCKAEGQSKNSSSNSRAAHSLVEIAAGILKICEIL